MHDATIHMSREAMLAHTIADTLNTSGFFLRYATKALRDNDTLYIGCEKFPYHNAMTISVSGVL